MGSCGYLFRKIGLITLELPSNISFDTLFEDAIDAGAEDIKSDNNLTEVSTIIKTIYCFLIIHILDYNWTNRGCKSCKFTHWKRLLFNILRSLIYSFLWGTNTYRWWNKTKVRFINRSIGRWCGCCWNIHNFLNFF